MICPRCQTINPDGAVYCSGCGRPLLRRPASRKKSSRPFLLVAGGVAVLVILYLMYRLIAPGPPPGPARGSETVEARAGRVVPSEEGSLSPAFGEFFVRGAGDREVYRTMAAVFEGEWVALPVSALLGGEDLSFQEKDSGAVRISAGTWAAGDPVVFWKVKSGPPQEAFTLAVWNPELPLDWHSARPNDRPLDVETDSARKIGAFAGFPAPPEIRHPGVFLQEGKVVGWTFGDPFDQAYLWSGAPAAGPPRDITVDEFFSAVSADCREGYYRRLLDSGPSETPSAELEALARGFRLPPLLAPLDLPPDLRQPAIVGRMDALASALIQNGQGSAVSRILDDVTIRESADPALARDAVLALAEGQDYNRTIRRLEAIEQDVFAARGPVPAQLGELKSRLYKDWLRKIIEKGDYYSGAVAFEEAQRAFPDDPEIRLLGAVIAFADNNTGRAKELLDQGGFPPALKEQADRLRAQLEEKPDKSEDVVISFNPVEDYIPVDAVINGFYLQKFVIDTGASIVTIPSAAAVALNIKVDESLPAKAVATAGGVAYAYEVTLDSIRLDRYTVNNIKALVMDVPGVGDYGILGLSYLNNFRVEIDKPKGILRLRKRTP